MRKIDSINYGWKLLIIVFIVLLVVPGVLGCFYLAFKNSVLIKIAIGIMILGFVLLFLFLLFISIELLIDHKVNKKHLNNTKVLSSKNNTFECPFCGFLLTEKTDFCPCCLKKFTK